LLNDALKIRRRLAREDPDQYLPDLAKTLNNLGLLYAQQAETSKARQTLSEALAIGRKLARKTRCHPPAEMK
jgi:Tfp pilus assembly protein PilF